jgi:hypothetical protein
MAFLDNSGDIILDAVLTDEGRRRLAKGDGSFKIVKFALGDDEIDYALYNGDHPSGSAYYDLDLLQTPVLEAFTNNIASMHNKLLSLPRTDLLFMPIIKLNTYIRHTSDLDIMKDSYIIPVNANAALAETTNGLNQNGNDGALTTSNYLIQLDQGLDTTKLSFSQPAPADLTETEYMVTIDNKLGYITDSSENQQNYVSIDDDGYATYNFSKDIDTDFVSQNTNTINASSNNYQIIAGPRGTILKFGIKPSINLVDDYLFDLLGTTAAAAANTLYAAAANVKIIKTSILVEGVSTGYRVEIPICFFRKV